MLTSDRRSHHALGICFTEQFYGPVIPLEAILLYGVVEHGGS
jgi:hypothetical protein